MTAVDIGQLDGSVAVPRNNGELVFAEPWEGTAFGLAVALTEVGVIDWADFRARLIAYVAAGTDDESGNVPYYVCWMAALEDLLASTAILDSVDISARAQVIVATQFEHGGVR